VAAYAQTLQDKSKTFRQQRAKDDVIRSEGARRRALQQEGVLRQVQLAQAQVEERCVCLCI